MGFEVYQTGERAQATEDEHGLLSMGWGAFLPTFTPLRLTMDNPPPIPLVSPQRWTYGPRRVSASTHLSA